MLKLFKEEAFPYKALTIAVLLTTVFFVCRIIYAGVISIPYPKELLEPSNILLTNQIVSGKNPYQLSVLLQEIPGVNYDYAFLNSLFAAVIVKITGFNAVTAHFAISLFSILASGVIGFVILKNQTRTTVSPCILTILFMFCHWRYGYISAAPDDLGLLFFILTMYITTCSHIRHKPFVCALGITLCFYTKQYFVFVAIPIFIYMFLYSKTDALKLFLWTIMFNGIIALLITLFWPLYWTKAFLFTYLGTVVGGGNKISTFIDQIEYLAVLFAGIFITLILIAFKAVLNYFLDNERIKRLKVEENNPIALHVITLVVMTIPLLVLGRNDGAFLSYFLQLWMPSVAIVTLIGVERIEFRRFEKTYIAFYSVLILSTLYFGYNKLPLHVLTEKEMSDWDKALEYTQAYSEIGDVFYARSLSYDGFTRGNGEWICDHDGEVSEQTVGELLKAGVPDKYVDYARLIVEQNLRYREYIANKASNHGYSLITFEINPAQRQFDKEVCEKIGYIHKDTLELRLGNMPYDVAFYVPRM